MENYKGLPNFEEYTEFSSIEKDSPYVQNAIEFFRQMDYNEKVFSIQLADEIAMPKKNHWQGKLSNIVMFINCETDMFILSGSNGYKKVIDEDDIKQIYEQFRSRANKSMKRCIAIGKKLGYDVSNIRFIDDPIKKENDSDNNIKLDL